MSPTPPISKSKNPSINSFLGSDWLEKYMNSPQMKATRYVSEAMHNTLGIEEHKYQKQMQDMHQFKSKYKQEYIAKHFPDAARLFKESRQRRLTPKEYEKFNVASRTADMRSNTATRKKYKKQLEGMRKYSDRRQKFISSKHEEYAQSDPAYRKYIEDRKKSNEVNLKGRQKEDKEWLTWAKKNDPSMYKRWHQRAKQQSPYPTQHYAGQQQRDPFGRSADMWDWYQDVHKSQNKYRSSQKKPAKISPLINLGSGIFKSPEKPLTPKYSPPPVQQIKPKPIVQTSKPKPVVPKFPVPTSPFKRGKPKYNQAAYLAGLQSAPMTMGQKMKPQQGIYKPYANGGGVRKPKYNKKG